MGCSWSRKACGPNQQQNKMNSSYELYTSDMAGNIADIKYDNFLSKTKFLQSLLFNQ